ncbi:hypothetical protein AC579_8007 [Pseudocercospora musae]|uniref:Uncharacterized protein n=1 Tax=Pseudocercospora musae TaxID=113226 RepID=A0A139I4N9_9PEZI|nr:hypothetical protein AC579_8007 [Pseudocercospora musae]
MIEDSSPAIGNRQTSSTMEDSERDVSRPLFPADNARASVFSRNSAFECSREMNGNHHDQNAYYYLDSSSPALAPIEEKGRLHQAIKLGLKDIVVLGSQETGSMTMSCDHNIDLVKPTWRMVKASRPWKFSKGLIQIDSKRPMAKVVELAQAYKANEQLSAAITLLQSLAHVRNAWIAAEYCDHNLYKYLLVSALIVINDLQRAVPLWDRLLQYHHAMSEENHAYLTDIFEALLEARLVIAQKYFKQGRIAEAIDLMGRIVAGHATIFSPEVHERYAAECNPIFFYIEDLQLQQARQLLEQVSKIAHLLPEKDQVGLLELESRTWIQRGKAPLRREEAGSGNRYYGSRRTRAKTSLAARALSSS